MSERMINDGIVKEEIHRVYPETVDRGEQVEAIHLDMKEWAISNGMWNDDKYDYKNIVHAYGKARGWTQEHFSGLEVYDTSSKVLGVSI